MGHTIRLAGREDVGTILSFIRLLAEYENMSELVSADEALLEREIFGKEGANVLILTDTESGEDAGFALYFHNFSTFLGKRGIYLEDLFVKEQYRHKGYGKALLCELAKIAKSKGCGRLEWCCLDWNTPSIDFYKSLGAIPMDEWTTYRLTEDKIARLADMN